MSFYFWRNQHVQHKSSRKLGILDPRLDQKSAIDLISGYYQVAMKDACVVLCQVKLGYNNFRWIADLYLLYSVLVWLVPTYIGYYGPRGRGNRNK